MDARVIISADAPDALTRVCGISLLERMLRVLQRLDVPAVTIVSETPDEITHHLAQPSWARANLRVDVRGRKNAALRASDIGFGPAVVLSTGYYDARLLAALLTQSTTTLLVDSAPQNDVAPLLHAVEHKPIGYVANAAFVDRSWLAAAAANAEPLFVELTRAAAHGEIALLDAAGEPSYVTSMRRSIRPVWFPPPAPGNIVTAERIIFDTAQNGTLDLPAIVHGPIETWIIARLCRTSVTPNQITIFTAIVSAIIAVLFASGHLIPGAILALIVGVLDGLDGKQARVKVETTPLGQREHALDYVLELSWWTALAFHFARGGRVPNSFALLALLVVSDLIDRVAKKHAKKRTGRHLDDVAPIDRFVRLIGGRRNIYIWIFAVGLLWRAAHQAYVALCCWGALTAVVHVCRAVYIGWQTSRRRGERASD